MSTHYVHLPVQQTSLGIGSVVDVWLSKQQLNWKQNLHQRTAWH